MEEKPELRLTEHSVCHSVLVQRCFCMLPEIRNPNRSNLNSRHVKIFHPLPDSTNILRACLLLGSAGHSGGRYVRPKVSVSSPLFESGAETDTLPWCQEGKLVVGGKGTSS